MKQALNVKNGELYIIISDYATNVTNNNYQRKVLYHPINNRDDLYTRDYEEFQKKFTVLPNSYEYED